MTDTLPTAGEVVRLVSPVTFASRTFEAGTYALVETVHTYESGVVDGDMIAEARMVEGLYVENTPAYSIVVPLTRDAFETWSA